MKTRLFEILSLKIEEMHLDIISEDGNGEKIRKMKKSDSFFHDGTKLILTSLAKIFAWTHKTLSSLVEHLEQIDAGIACFEVCSDLVEAISDLSFGSKLGITKPFGKATDIFKEGASKMQEVENILTLVPSPEDISKIITNIELLLGDKQEEWENEKYLGSLGELIHVIS